MKEWKVGDKVVGTVTKIDGEGCILVDLGGYSGCFVRAATAVPLPAAITPKAQALLDAAVGYLGAGRIQSYLEWSNLTTAVRAYEASITSPDPAETLLAALDAYHSGKSSVFDLMAARDAFRASRGAKP